MKDIVRRIYVAFLFMLQIILVSCVCFYIQFLGMKKIGSTSGIIFSGDLFKYNYFSYIVGMVLYFYCFYKRYNKKFSEYIKNLIDCKIGVILIVWICLVVMGFLMFFVLVFVSFAKFGLCDDIYPGYLMMFSSIGWPIITVVVIGADMIYKKIKSIGEE